MGFKFVSGKGFVPTEDLDGLIRNAYWWQFKGEELFLDELQAKRDRDGYRDSDTVEARCLLGLEDGLDGVCVRLGDGVVSAIPTSLWDKGEADCSLSKYALTNDDLRILGKEPLPSPTAIAPQKEEPKQPVKPEPRSEFDKHACVRAWLMSRGDDMAYWSDENIDLLCGPLRAYAMTDIYLVDIFIEPREVVREVSASGDYSLYSSLVRRTEKRYAICYRGVWSSTCLRALTRFVRRLVNCGGLIDAEDKEKRLREALLSITNIPALKKDAVKLDDTYGDRHRQMLLTRYTR